MADSVARGGGAGGVGVDVGVSSKKRKREMVPGREDDNASPSKPGAVGESQTSKKISNTSAELLEVTVEQAQAALQRLIDGWTPDPNAKNFQPNSVGWGPAVKTCDCCVLVQKRPSVSKITLGILRALR